MNASIIIVTRILAAWPAAHAEEICDEGCSEEELTLVYNCAMIQGHIKARIRPHKYEKHGLVKLDAAMQEVPS